MSMEKRIKGQNTHEDGVSPSKGGFQLLAIIRELLANGLEVADGVRKGKYFFMKPVSKEVRALLDFGGLGVLGSGRHDGRGKVEGKMGTRSSRGVYIFHFRPRNRWIESQRSRLEAEVL